MPHGKGFTTEKPPDYGLLCQKLITRRSQVQVLSPQPKNPETATVSGFSLYPVAICILFSRRATFRIFFILSPSYIDSPKSEDLTLVLGTQLNVCSKVGNGTRFGIFHDT